MLHLTTNPLRFIATSEQALETKKQGAIYEVYVKFGYALKEIADYLTIHYATVSKIVREVEGGK